jgi:NhaA family Na+:H+ antiporter
VAHVERNFLASPVEPGIDHILGPYDAPITLVEYGSYDCPNCRAANERIADVRDELGDRLRYVFRHRPVPGSELARAAAELAERAPDADSFWEAHVALMTRSSKLTRDDLAAVASKLKVDLDEPEVEQQAMARAKARVDRDMRSARASGVIVTPTFFINDRKYEGVWEEAAFADALLGSMGHRVRAAALDFARWAPSAGVLLLVATVLAVVLTNSLFGPAFLSFWQEQLGITFASRALRMPLLQWVNDGLLTLFFLVVGLEIKREFTVGHLSTRRSAALPVAAAIGGMVVPVMLYALFVPSGPWAHGWGVPMATDTAFAVALIVMMGDRVPVELRIFLTAAAIVDDIGAIAVVALFYSHGLDFAYLAVAGVATFVLFLLNRGAIFQVGWYVLTGLVLWLAVLAGGLHATLAGVILAMFIPTRRPPNVRALRAQTDAVLQAEMRRQGDVLRQGISTPALRALDAIHDRLESPADRMLRTVSLRSNYFVLPIFALANAGVELSANVLRGHGPLLAAIAVALVVGKPVGLVSASLLAVRLGIAEKPAEYSWRHLTGAGALAGIGFTMSLFIAGQAFPDPAAYAAAKIAVFAASIVSALIGVAILWNAKSVSEG